MNVNYTKANLATIEFLKARGYQSIQFNLMKAEEPLQAKVEVIPNRKVDFELDSIVLSSKEILDYFDGTSPMVEYVIDQHYL